jgi:Fe-Mn family superoxide dismutase
MDLKKYRDFIIEAETARDKLVQENLPYKRDDLDPVMSKDTVDYHFGKLAAAYVRRYNDKEGDDSFNYGGATLHNIFFPQMQPPTVGNKPSGTSEQLINNKHGNFEKFKDEFIKSAMSIQGSGWVYMDTKGNIKTISNHKYTKGMKIALLVDMWEHAFALDYQHDKSKYLNNIWKIINWNVVNDRLQGE